MGVPGFFAWLLKNKKKLGVQELIIKNFENKIKWIMLDTNCLLHPCVSNILEKYNKGLLKINLNEDIRTQLENYIWIKIKSSIDDIIDNLKPEYIYIGIDGVAPMGKILQQRQRRYRFLFEKKNKSNNIDIFETKLQLNDIEEPIIPISSIELTPGTDYMERINNCMIEYLKELEKKGIKYIYSSYHEEGEGEHKIFQYIKKNLNISDLIVIYGLDADLLFLSLGLGFNYNLYIMREKQIFMNAEIDFDKKQEYNFVEIKQLHLLISNLNISTNDFILLCYLIGNDFLPKILTLDIKKGGLDKVFKAWDIVKKKNGIKNYNNTTIKSYLVYFENSKYQINLILLKELFEELRWTEKYIWKNINRDIIFKNEELNQDEIKILKNTKLNEKIEEMNKFILGESSNTNFIEKIQFNTSNEYYQNYLGIKCLNIDKNIIIKMVQEYINGIDWCINYYLNDCLSWSYGYNFMIAPLINDIIAFFPNKKITNFKFIDRQLNPVEQLILAIPPQTFKYVIEKNIINEIKSNINIGFMIPEDFEIDVNNESLLWKCHVKLPIVEYNEFILEIKKINIINCKNTIHKYISNF